MQMNKYSEYKEEQSESGLENEYLTHACNIIIILIKKSTKGPILWVLGLL